MKWQRLTILDLLLLMLSYSVAGSLCVWSYEANVWTYPSTKMALFLPIVVAGNALAPLFILTTQYVFRHRRKWPSEGEWLWLVPIALYSGALYSQFFVNPAPAQPFLMGVLILCSVLATLCLFFRAFGYWGMATCRWTDVFGALTCLSTGALLVLDLPTVY